MTLSSLAVFCGSSTGTDPELGEQVYQVGRALAVGGIRLVYGAGGAGLMGALSQGALDGGGEVVGVIPRMMVEREWGRPDLTRLIVCDSMHERKAIMADEAEAFLALPGGLGTLEEIFEVWTWRSIGFHAKPVGFLDLDGFWGPLLTALNDLRDAGFVRPGDLESVVVADNLDAVLNGLRDRLPPEPHTLAHGT